MIEKKYFALTIKYDGTRYLGWQVQPQSPTIQEEIETALHRLTGSKVRIIGAGRTDAGVHAHDQHAHFAIDTRLDEHALFKGLNAVLPDDILITSVQQVGRSFHARFSAVGKYYMYIVHQGTLPPLFTRNYAWHVKYPLSIEKMRDAAQLFIGTHNFHNFCANSGRENETFERTIIDIRIDHIPPFIVFHVLGKSFLYKMVRLMVGTLIDIGRNKTDASIITAALATEQPVVPAPVSPAHGLTLKKVFYDLPVELPSDDIRCNLFSCFDVLNIEE